MRPNSLKEAVARMGQQGFFPPLDEFLDQFYLAEERQAFINDEPRFTGDAWQDAYIGAVAEHLARRWGLMIPPWVDDPRRFLDTPCFADDAQWAKPVLLRDSPIAFRRRLIFTEAEPLRRARFPRPTAEDSRRYAEGQSAERAGQSGRRESEPNKKH